jgi:hypothetical protein
LIKAAEALKAKKRKKLTSGSLLWRSKKHKKSVNQITKNIKKGGRRKILW